MIEACMRCGSRELRWPSASDGALLGSAANLNERASQPGNRGVRLYQLKEGQIAYILHRVSGVAVILFLFVHLVENFFLLMGPAAYNAAIGIYDHWWFRLGEFGLVAAVVYHALNGCRII